ncbi:MFS transporter [Candidatus Peregrinibacteria bacterium]|nr:MFS transporter [Candidatus Peregrinibacteria bacterium]
MIPQNTPKKTLKIFGWASFLNDFGSDIIFPLWPMFLTSVLGANMAVLGFIDGLGNAIVSVSQAISGYIADKTGKRKIFVWLGYIFSGLSRIGYAFSPTWHFLIPFRVLDRAGKMRGAPRDAIIADISTDQNRGRNFGYLRMMDNFGAVCGVIFTIIFFKYFGYQNLFFLAAIPSFVGAILIFRSTKEYVGADKKIFKGITFRDFHRDLKLYLLLSTIFALSSFSYSFLLIYAQKFGFAGASIPVLYLVYSIMASIVSFPFGKLADKINRKPVLILSFIFWLFACVVFIYFQNPVGIIIAFLLYGLHLGAIEPVQRALVSELSVPELRASTLGTFQMIIGLAALPASLIAGILWDKVGITAPFYFSALLTLLAIGILLIVREKRVLETQ